MQQPHRSPCSVDIAPLANDGLAGRAAVTAALTDRSTALAGALERLNARAQVVAEIAALLTATLRRGGKLLVAGNGGSAAEAQHFATELVGRFRRERDAYAVVALTADTAVLTAVANDYGFEEVFARQVRALGRVGDALLLFSTSGESENVVRAAAAGRALGLTVVAVTGGRPNRLARAADLAVRVPTDDTPLAQELHVVLLHLLCDLVEADLAASPRLRPAPAPVPLAPPSRPRGAASAKVAGGAAG